MSKGSAISSFGPALSGKEEARHCLTRRTQHCLTRRTQHRLARRTQHCLATANPAWSWGSGGLPPASQRNKEKKGELPPSHPRRRALLASAPSSLSFYWERRTQPLLAPSSLSFYSGRRALSAHSPSSLSFTRPESPLSHLHGAPSLSLGKELPICTHDCQPRTQLGVRFL